MKYLIALFFTLTTSLSSYEVLTISDAVIDYLVCVDEPFFDELPGRKGGTEFIDVALFQHLLSCAEAPPIKHPGGSGANMVKGLARFGHDCAVIGCIGDDAEGDFFHASLVENGVHPLLEKCSLPTGRIASFIAPDKSRTMRSLRGAADNIGNHILDPQLFQGIKLFHLEGYKLLYPHIAKLATHLAILDSTTTIHATLYLVNATHWPLDSHRDNIGEDTRKYHANAISEGLRSAHGNISTHRTPDACRPSPTRCGQNHP